MSQVRILPGVLEPGRVADDEAVAGGRCEVPAGAGALLVADRVPAQAGDLGEGVAGVGVDGDPLTGAGGAPALEGAGGEGFGDQAAAEEGEADRAGAVVAVGVEGAVTAAPDVGPADDCVCVVDHALD